MPLKIGVVGTGVMGAQHAYLLAREVRGCEVVALADVDTERVGRIADDLAVPMTFTDGMDLVQASSVDAVLVASSDASHFALVAECIRRGKPVLCEKPLATTSAECRQLVDAEMNAGKRLVQVGFMRRFDPDYVAMKQAIDSGQHGLPLLLHCIHRIATAPHYFTTEIIPHASAVHEIDLAQFLLREEFTRISVRPGRAPSRAPSRRPLLFILETASGVLVDIEIFADAGYGYDVRAELVLEDGALGVGEPVSTTLRSAGRAGHSLDADWSRRFEFAYRRQAEAWIRSAVTGEPSGASAWDGYLATRMAEECVVALTDGAERYLIPEPAPEFYAPARGGGLL